MEGKIEGVGGRRSIKKITLTLNAEEDQDNYEPDAAIIRKVQELIRRHHSKATQKHEKKKKEKII